MEEREIFEELLKMWLQFKMRDSHVWKREVADFIREEFKKFENKNQQFPVFFDKYVRETFLSDSNPGYHCEDLFEFLQWFDDEFDF